MIAIAPGLSRLTACSSRRAGRPTRHSRRFERLEGQRGGMGPREGTVEHGGNYLCKLRVLVIGSRPRRSMAFAMRMPYYLRRTRDDTSKIVPGQGVHQVRGRGGTARIHPHVQGPSVMKLKPRSGS